MQESIIATIVVIILCASIPWYREFSHWIPESRIGLQDVITEAASEHRNPVNRDGSAWRIVESMPRVWFQFSLI